MSDFEFFRNVPIGQYLPVDSLLHRLDARARIILFTLLLFATTFTQHPIGLLISLVIILAGLMIANIPLGYALRGLIPLLPFLILLTFLQLFFNTIQQPSPVILRLGPIAITQADLLASIVFLMRFVGLILILSLATFTISPAELTHGLETMFRPFSRLGIPINDFVMAVQITLRFIPILAQNAEQIAKAQASRGAEWGTTQGHLLGRVRQVIPIIIPLFLTSLHRADNMALAMELRGYGGREIRTSMIELRFSWKDAITIFLALSLAAAILLI